jgi:hypothetical protein
MNDCSWYELIGKLGNVVDSYRHAEICHDRELKLG